ncbi:aminoglycoside phosphotransferase family protein [Rhodocytophaga aerolata]|uniref:Aminoglycoside phosphotransferase family protein n=1 Tax=Rhodocytophaga aerolata TaxID=455078 RepID=A0ABT8RCZ7_9BACT|nr:aminoglycoside phosphotransferase family protein [Rhodocytophaga aerolata]MDO1449884.1 aminoglycoside phosphotransferase family protein [Rhodocytophaga aerolata]
MRIDSTIVKNVIEEKLNKRLISFSLKGEGMCNYAWYAISEDNQIYMIKQEKPEKEEEEHNDLLTEAGIIRKLNEKSSSLPVPQLIFVADNPKMYGYQYIEGEMMKSAWGFLSQQEKILLCEDLGKFHALLGNALTMEEIGELKVTNRWQAALEKETEDDVKLFLHDASIPQPYKQLIKRLYKIQHETKVLAHFGLCHNDSHHENILLNEGKLAGIIDFGDSDFGDVHREFARYVQDYPHYVEIIVNTYEKLSGKTLCRRRMLAISLLEIVDDLRTEYIKNGRMELLDRLSLWFTELTLDR